MRDRTFRLLIVQPYIPGYRVGFFERLTQHLSTLGVTCRVAAAQPVGSQALRGDAAEQPWIFPLRTRQLKLPAATFVSYGSGPARARADGVIVGLQASCWDSWAALLRRGASPARVGVWGHVGSYVRAPNVVDSLLEGWQARRADHVFAYTANGAEQAVRYGCDPARVTAVMNSLDVSPMAHEISTIQDSEVRAFWAQHHLQPGRCAAYLGGLDDAKRIDFLADALDAVWQIDPAFRLLIGGLGADAYRLARGKSRGQVIHLGYARARDKALVARSASALANPGRIGLVAVEALAMRLPIVTVEGARHGPEAEYLNPGVSLFSTPNDPILYARELVAIAKLSRPPETWTYPSLEQMVGNFAAGVLKLATNQTHGSWRPRCELRTHVRPAFERGDGMISPEQIPHGWCRCL